MELSHNVYTHWGMLTRLPKEYVTVVRMFIQELEDSMWQPKIHETVVHTFIQAKVENSWILKEQVTVVHMFSQVGYSKALLSCMSIIFLKFI